MDTRKSSRTVKKPDFFTVKGGTVLPEIREEDFEEDDREDELEEDLLDLQISDTKQKKRKIPSAEKKKSSKVRKIDTPEEDIQVSTTNFKNLSLFGKSLYLLITII